MNLTCRICEENLHQKIFHIKDMPLTDDFIDKNDANRQEYLSDIQIFRCSNCGVVQNPNDFNHENYYKDYQYSTGHSKFAQNFMKKYADVTCSIFREFNKKSANSVLEIGSGDGQQLLYFKDLGINTVYGVEPSEVLALQAEKLGVNTEIALFDTDMISKLPKPFDICISSYTFDHVRNPLNYLLASNASLTDNGIIAFEIHDLEKIVDRTEFCLFEHEHTIYLTKETATSLMEMCGFSVISINPLPEVDVRGNSLILIGKKIKNITKSSLICRKFTDERINGLQIEIEETVKRLDTWIQKLPEKSKIVGFGAGGRGVMTLAALKNASKIRALLDTNYKSNELLAPKTRIPIVGPNEWKEYDDCFCIIFSYGYYKEITESLIEQGFDEKKIFSLLDFYPK